MLMTTMMFIWVFSYDVYDLSDGVVELKGFLWIIPLYLFDVT